MLVAVTVRQGGIVLIRVVWRRGSCDIPLGFRTWWYNAQKGIAKPISGAAESVCSLAQRANVRSAHLAFVVGFLSSARRLVRTAPEKIVGGRSMACPGRPRGTRTSPERS